MANANQILYTLGLRMLTHGIRLHRAHQPTCTTDQGRTPTSLHLSSEAQLVLRNMPWGHHTPSSTCCHIVPVPRKQRESRSKVQYSEYLSFAS
jgi:hypothetical protein